MLGRSKTDPEDAQTKGEATHMADCCRLACATRPIIREAKKEASKEFKRPNVLTPRDILRRLTNQSYGHARRY